MAKSIKQEELDRIKTMMLEGAFEEHGTFEPPAKQWVCFGKASNIPVDHGATVKYGRHQFAVFNYRSAGDWYACQNMSPKSREMILSEGWLSFDKDDNPTVMCLKNQEIYSLETGENLVDPTSWIETFPVSIVDGRIYIELPSESELDKMDICDWGW